MENDGRTTHGRLYQPLFGGFEKAKVGLRVTTFLLHQQ